MKKIVVFFVFFAFVFCYNNIFAQEDTEIDIVGNEIDETVEEEIAVEEIDLAEAGPAEAEVELAEVGEAADAEYLTEDDVLAVETELAEDTPPTYEERQTVVAEEDTLEEVTQAEGDILEEETVEVAEVKDGNEMARLNSSLTFYHLLILDRIYSPLYSDLSGMENMTVLYKFLHGKDGYLIAVYKNSKEGPVFPQTPNDSRVLVDFVTVWPDVIKEYINSAAFRRFVTSRKIISDLQNLF